MTKKLVITGTDPVTVEINPDSVIIYHQDIHTSEEEAHTIIVQQVADVRLKKALIVADDTDIFCVASSLLLQRRHTGTSFNFCRDGFTH